MSCWRAQSQHVFSFRSRWDLVRSFLFRFVPFRSFLFRFVPFRSFLFRFVPFRSFLFSFVPYRSLWFVLLRSFLFCDVPFRSGRCLIYNFLILCLFGGTSSGIALLYERPLLKPSSHHRLNMELDLQFIWTPYAQLYSLVKTPHLGSYTSQGRRHLFVTPASSCSSAKSR